VLLPAFLRLWLLRILIPLDGCQGFINRMGFDSDQIAHFFRLDEWIDPDGVDFDPKVDRQLLHSMHKAAEVEASQAVLQVKLKQNVRKLADLDGLSVADCRILEFTVLIHNERILDDTADYLGVDTRRKLTSSG
jgi:hypothetical protein